MKHTDVRFFRMITNIAAVLCAASLLALCLVFAGCGKDKGLSEDEIASLSSGVESLLERTVNKPWRGEDFAPGKVGGVWYSSIENDPKSFNLFLAEGDGPTSAIVSGLHCYLLDYDYVKREFTPLCASAEIAVDEAAGKLDVIYTLRDDIYWSYYNDAKPRVKVTSDDVVFWYNEIEGDPAFASQAYPGQFIMLEDGTEAHVDIEKIDSRRFVFHFPRLNANPLLHTNMQFGPRFLYESAKRAGGKDAVEKLFSAADDPKTFPSMGRWFLTEYSPGQRIVYVRNPDYWDKDAAGTATPYIEQVISTVVPDDNTQYLLFKGGKLESNMLKPENIEEAVNSSGPGPGGFTVFNAEGSIGATMWSFNQNPANKDKPFYSWFTKKEFRQAMSCILNRDRIITQIYRGLGEPKLDFFPPPNPYYNEDIKLQYLYDTARAEKLLASIGLKKDSSGVMRDGDGNAVEYDLCFASEATILNDIAAIVADECAKIGIKVNPRPTDFQRIGEQLSRTFDWQSMFLGLGTNFWPSSGSNVWPSTGSLHIWNPSQKSPATTWEARVDYLYNEGSYTIDREQAQAIWDEYQRILLEELPVVYLTRARAFAALYNRWDFTNVYYDNIGGLQTDKIWLKAE
ncbi:MAG: ABC transporter substrate-binding protein [Treponemataceae bacterium]|nr:MAG: ABC transporter substrate-binding protein [Treponemataceae bacterium]